MSKRPKELYINADDDWNIFAPDEIEDIETYDLDWDGVLPPPDGAPGHATGFDNEWERAKKILEDAFKTLDDIKKIQEKIAEPKIICPILQPNKPPFQYGPSWIDEIERTDPEAYKRMKADLERESRLYEEPKEKSNLSSNDWED